MDCLRAFHSQAETFCRAECAWSAGLELCQYDCEKLDKGRIWDVEKYQPEQVVNLLRQIEVAVANGKSTPLACKEVCAAKPSYYRWRKEYGGMKADQAQRLKELEQENSKLKRLVAELSLDKQILQDIARGDF